MLDYLEELFKARMPTKEQLDDIKRLSAIHRDSTDPKEKAAALEQIKSYSFSPKKTKPPVKSRDAAGDRVIAENPGALNAKVGVAPSDPISAAKLKATGHIKKLQQDQIAQNIQAARGKVAQDAQAKKEAKAEQLAHQKATERQANLLPGSEYTQEELQAQANKTQPKEWQPKEVPSTKAMSPEIQQKVTENKNKSLVDSIMESVHTLHDAGKHGSAYDMMSSIPKEHLPKELNSYNPAYLHYNIPPKTWGSLDQAGQNHVHNFHDEVMGGKHPDFAHVQKLGQGEGVQKSLSTVLSSLKQIRESLDKSNYGPKGAKLYSAVDNMRRKANNVGDVAGVGPNTNVKAISTRVGQAPGKVQTDNLVREQKKKNKKQPVKTFTPEQISQLQIERQRNKP